MLRAPPAIAQGKPDEHHGRGGASTGPEQRPVGLPGGSGRLTPCTTAEITEEIPEATNHHLQECLSAGTNSGVDTLLEIDLRSDEEGREREAMQKNAG